MPTAFLHHPLFPRHEMPAGHPECGERVTCIVNALRTAGVYEALDVVEPPPADDEALLRVHSPGHLARMAGIEPGDGLVAIDPDTFVGPHSLSAARRAAGALVAATDRVIAGDADTAFCCVRPPGHHAERDAAMGFCLYNNVAVGAAHALEHHGLSRVAILDFDVHHGNGTEDIVAGDERILFCSSFQHPFYPGGSAAPSAANIVKTPLPAGCEGDRFRAAIDAQWLPAIEAFDPELIFVSAGFDAHVEDALSGLRLIDEDYAWISDWIVERARAHTGGRIVSALEGGYALGALARCATRHIEALSGLK